MCGSYSSTFMEWDVKYHEEATGKAPTFIMHKDSSRHNSLLILKLSKMPRYRSTPSLQKISSLSVAEPSNCPAQMQ